MWLVVFMGCINDMGDLVGVVCYVVDVMKIILIL